MPPAHAPSPLLSDALVILAAAGVVIPAFARLRVTPVIGFILIGLAVGPHGLGVFVERWPWLVHITIADAERIEPVAEFGIILLLFAIGLELSFKRLWTMRRLIFGVGAAELLGSASILALGLMLFSPESAGGAWGLGLALALSSTALVLPMVDTQRGVGRAALAMLLFEDLAIVPIIFLLGALGSGANAGADLVTTLLVGGVVVTVMLVAGRMLLSPLFAQAARTKSPELFLAASLLVVIGASLATGAAGLSPIVGALIAGLLIAETDYHGEVETITAPFRGLALGVFLITVGMRIDLAMVAGQWAAILGATLGVIAIKTLVTAGLLRLSGARAATAAEAGLLMASPSETTLIVLGVAAAAGLIGADTASFWQVVTAIGLTLTPLLARLGRFAARRVEHHGGEIGDIDVDLSEPRIVIIGLGRVGRLVADMLAQHGQRYMAIEDNVDAVERGQDDEYHVRFGDASKGDIVTRLDLANARALVLTMDQPVLAARIVRRVRSELPDLPIIARARDVNHAAELYRAGASHAVPETLESSLQLSEAVLVAGGAAVGPVIASIHEKRDEFRQRLMRDGQLDEKPKLKSGA